MLLLTLTSTARHLLKAHAADNTRLQYNHVLLTFATNRIAHGGGKSNSPSAVFHYNGLQSKLVSRTMSRDHSGTECACGRPIYIYIWYMVFYIYIYIYIY